VELDFEDPDAFEDQYISDFNIDDKKQENVVVS
jgi:hypothetical protein